VGPEGGLSGWLKVARLARPSWREAAVTELQGLAPGGPVLARGRFYWASLRIARWVANRCVWVLLCVAPAFYGMQEVSGSSPLSSTRSRMEFER
jgi:hypothetical protein